MAERKLFPRSATQVTDAAIRAEAAYADARSVVDKAKAKANAAHKSYCDATVTPALDAYTEAGDELARAIDDAEDAGRDYNRAATKAWALTRG